MPAIGEKLGRYVLLERLASGGMGDVFVAAKPGPVGFGPLVAVKVLREELAGDGQFVDMLIDEANIAKHLNHPNLVSVLDLGEDGGHYFIAMEYVQGITAERLIESSVARGEHLDVCSTLYIGVELCRGLRSVHECRNDVGEPLGIIHRDVTPANILLSVDGEVKLTDFGIARARGRVHQTQAGVLKGKFGYMAPEMVRYEKLDARADLFCAGVVLYLLACGRHPVAQAPVMEAIRLYEQKQIPPPSVFNSAIDPAVDAALMSALEPRPEMRWQSAEAMGEHLHALMMARPESRDQARDPTELLARRVRRVAPEATREPVDQPTRERLLALHRGRPALRVDDLDTDENRPESEVAEDEPATAPSPPVFDEGPLVEPELPSTVGRGATGDDRTVAGYEWDLPERTIADGLTDEGRTVVALEPEPETLLPGHPAPEEWEDPSATLLDSGVGSAPLPWAGSPAQTVDPTASRRLAAADSGASRGVGAPIGPANPGLEREGAVVVEADDGAPGADVDPPVADAGTSPRKPDRSPEAEAGTLERTAGAAGAKAGTGQGGTGQGASGSAGKGAPGIGLRTFDGELGPGDGRPEAVVSSGGVHPHIREDDLEPPEAGGDSLHAGRANPSEVGRSPRIVLGRAPSGRAPLDWSDDAAAIRAVETRNGPSSPPAAWAGSLQEVPSASHQPRRPARLQQVAAFGWARALGLLGLAGALFAGLAWVWFGTAVFWPRLQVETNPPGARIRVDGRAHGRPTPTTLTLAPGERHTIELAVDGYRTEQRQLTEEVSRGRVYRLDVIFERRPPRVFVSPEPATVSVNGEPVGEGRELELADLPEAGPIEIRVFARGYEPYTVRFEDREAMPSALDVPLRRPARTRRK